MRLQFAPILPWLLCLLTLLVDGALAAEASPAADGRSGTDFVDLHVGHLTCRIGNNRALGNHRARYNGIFSMVSPDQEENLYVATYARLNITH